MKTILLTFTFFCVFQTHAAFDPKCPLSSMEPSPCHIETQDVVDTIKALKTKYGTMTEKVSVYCASEFTTPGRSGLQCRTLSLFFKSDGSLIKDIMIDRFIGHQTWRNHTYVTFLVEATPGVYKRYVDHKNEGKLIVDQYRVDGQQFGGTLPPNTFTPDSNVQVSFDSNGYPTFGAYYFNNTHVLKFTPHSAIFDGNFIVYNVQNKVSEQAISSDEDWDNFFDKEGLPAN